MNPSDRAPKERRILRFFQGFSRAALAAVLALLAKVVRAFRRRKAENAGEPRLTRREREILKLMAKGYAYREIAKELGIRPRTARQHVQNISRKLQLRPRPKLMRYTGKDLDRGAE